MNCPQCGTGLGEGAKACATCGWSKSKKTLWIVLGCVFGFLFLVCCGAGTFLYFKMKKAVEAMKDDVVPVQLGVLHAQVVNYAKIKGKAPANLEEAAAEPMVGKNGEKVEIKFENNNKTADMWQTAFRFTMNADRTFEIRSAGVDKQFDNADDLTERGSLDEDLPTLLKSVETRAKQMIEKGVRAIGIDPGKIPEDGPVPEVLPPPVPPETPPENPPKDPPTPPSPPPPDGGGK